MKTKICSPEMRSSETDSGAESGVGLSRWQNFTDEELQTIMRALVDSGRAPASKEWYMRCSTLHQQIISFTIHAASAQCLELDRSEP